jgi:hypothetical protein
VYPEAGNYFGKPNCSAPELIDPTLPEEYRTWNLQNLSTHGDFTKYHPWRAPGNFTTFTLFCCFCFVERT